MHVQNTFISPPGRTGLGLFRGKQHHFMGRFKNQRTQQTEIQLFFFQYLAGNAIKMIRKIISKNSRSMQCFPFLG